MLLEALEAGELDEYLVIAHGQRREHEATIAIRQPFDPAPAGHVKGDYTRTGKHASLCVLDHTGHFGGVGTVRGLTPAQDRTHRTVAIVRTRACCRRPTRGRLNHEPSQPKERRFFVASWLRLLVQCPRYRLEELLHWIPAAPFLQVDRGRALEVFDERRVQRPRRTRSVSMPSAFSSSSCRDRDFKFGEPMMDHFPSMRLYFACMNVGWYP